jgi:hypothetical protein
MIVTVCQPASAGDTSAAHTIHTAVCERLYFAVRYTHMRASTQVLQSATPNCCMTWFMQLAAHEQSYLKMKRMHLSLTSPKYYVKYHSRYLASIS